MRKRLVTLGLLNFLNISADAAKYPVPIRYIHSYTGTSADALLFRAGKTGERTNIPYYLNYNNLPSGWTEEMFAAALKKAMIKWQQVCNVSFNYQGTTDVTPGTAYGTDDRPQHIQTVIGFADRAAHANAVGMVANTLAQGGIDDLILNSAEFDETPGLDQFYILTNVLTHELGHVLGLADINPLVYPEGWKGVWNVTIMYNRSTDGPYSVAYRQHLATLRGADVMACQGIYGAPADEDIHRVFNSIEGDDAYWPFIGRRIGVFNSIEGDDDYWPFIGHRIGEITQYTTAPVEGKQLAYRYYPEWGWYIGISLNETPRRAYVLKAGQTKLRYVGPLQPFVQRAKAIDPDYGVPRY